MAKDFKELQGKMPREARLRSEASAEKLISEMGLAELRAAMDMTQESLANALHEQMANFARTYVGTTNLTTKDVGAVTENADSIEVRRVPGRP